MLDTIVSIASIASSIAIVIGSIIAIAQLKKATRIAEWDRLRQEQEKKEATIRFFDNITDKSTHLRAGIKEMTGGHPVTIKQIEANPDLKQCISQYLSLMERMAMGIYSGVFDYNVYRELYGTATINHYHQLREYIVNTRTRNNNPDIYGYFEKLALDIETNQRKHYPELSKERL